MATAFLSETTPGPYFHVDIMPDFPNRDNRYNSLDPSSSSNRRTSTRDYSTPNQSDREAHEDRLNTQISTSDPPRGSDPKDEPNRGQNDLQLRDPRDGMGASDLQSLRSQSQQSQQLRPESAVSYSLPHGPARRVVERYSLDDRVQRIPSRGSAETRPTAFESAVDTGASSQPRQHLVPGQSQNSPQDQERPISMLSSTRRQPTIPKAGIGAGPSNNTNYSPIMPLSASPAYNPPISPNHRAYPQHPTYITPPTAPNPVNTIYSPTPLVPQEEVCVECAMRDQEMADIDVSSPTAWERDSDVAFNEILQREVAEEAAGIVNTDPTRPKIRGDRLTEQNVEVWLTMNPREPTSRQHTLITYIKSQRALLEAEALARTRAMQESKQLDNRMRDTYSQLRRSAYDSGSSSAPMDDTGGVRIKPPQSPIFPTNHAHARSQSREITLLENGMIVEHVDVRKEEKEARERRRKEERRARKSSRSSGVDVTSLYSVGSLPAQPEGGSSGLKPGSRYSNASMSRPMSVLTVPIDRPDLPRAHSQASFSDVHSLGSGSPRRTRFFGFKNLSAGWRSQDSLAPSGMSGSMVDMHVALQREAYSHQYPAVDLATPSRRSQIWPPPEDERPQVEVEVKSVEKPKKKKVFSKIWHIVTGSTKHSVLATRGSSNSFDRNDDDLPLAPPPPLSYLVDRRPSEMLTTAGRHGSTPSLASVSSPKMGLSSPVNSGMSSSTAPSSILPSPTSLQSYGPGIGNTKDTRPSSGNYDENGHLDDIVPERPRSLHPVTSEPDMRRRLSTPAPSRLAGSPPLNALPASPLYREKSLPPLPAEARPRLTPSQSDTRPQTMFHYNTNLPPPGSGPAHDFLPPQAPFRTADARRQSFGGVASRPNVNSHTMPSRASGFDPRRSLAPQYGEFGHSRRSLGPLDGLDVQGHHPSVNTPMPTKRKSRFGLSSLLGRKKSTPDKPLMTENVAYQFPVIRKSGSDGQDEVLTNGYATSTSRHSALSTAAGQRMSVVSRKALEELVSQDTEFVAYRYPSNEQRLDLLR